MERFREIETVYQARGMSGAVEMINRHGPAIRSQETIYVLRDAKGVIIAGNSSVGPVGDGFSNLEADSTVEGMTGYKLYQGKLDANKLLVGINEGNTNQLAKIVLVSFGWTTAVVFLVALSGGALLRYRARARIFALSETAHAIGHGELSRRLPISARMDEIDDLSRQVNIAVARLESSVIALKQVTTDISHDLKTPVGRIFLVLDEVLQSDDIMAVKEGVSAALRELSILANTFDALLRIAQIESSSRTSRFSKVDLLEVAQEVYEAYEVIATDESYVLEIDAPQQQYPINGDADLLRQLLANLLANALRHTPAKSNVQIVLAYEADCVRLSVTDNGPGIPEAERDRVLERFYRLEKSRTSTGSGLGLSMVKAICDLHEAKMQMSDNSPGLRIDIHFAPFHLRPQQNQHRP